MNRTILQGDVLEKIKELNDESIECIITSPPYWNVRNYQVKGQIGLEPDYRNYLKTLQKVMAECKRILTRDGTCWINLADTYSKTKSLTGIPQRFYINCLDDGWIARNNIIWCKGNPMPTSVKDRFMNRHESLFFFSKSQKYYFKLDAVRETLQTESKPFNVRVRDTKRGLTQQKLTGGASKEELANHNKRGELKQSRTLGADGKPKKNYKGFSERWENRNNVNQLTQTLNIINTNNNNMITGKPLNSPKGKNPGDVFFLNTKPGIKKMCLDCFDIQTKITSIYNTDGEWLYDFCDICKSHNISSHYAAFPVELPLKILKCSCPRGCSVFDPFFGVGTVGIAAEQLGLRWCGIELSQEYITIAQKRLRKYRNKKL